MGNCLRHQTSWEWAGDDWGSLASETSAKAMKMEEDGPLGAVVNNKLGFASSSTSGATQVKIKITKKQLEELLSKVEVRDLSVQQVLAQLINVSDRFETHQRSWGPALKSIPEVNWQDDQLANYEQ